jgi:hypothetical protein
LALGEWSACADREAGRAVSQVFLQPRPGERASARSRGSRDDLSATFWLEPLALARNLGFSPAELREVERMLREHQQELLEQWYANYGH